MSDINRLIREMRKLEKMHMGKRGKISFSKRWTAAMAILSGHLDLKSTVALTANLVGYSHDVRFCALLAGTLVSAVNSFADDRWNSEDSAKIKKIVNLGIQPEEMVDTIDELIKGKHGKGKRTKGGLRIITGGRDE